MRSPCVILLVAALATLVPLPRSASAAVTVIPTAGRNVYRLAVARTGAEPLIIGTTWDNRLCAFSAAGRHRWDAALGGFAFDVTCADLDGDGTDEILTAGADGVIACFAIDGTERWRHALPAPAQQVTVARLDGKTPVVLAGGMSREILVFSNRGQVLRTVKTSGALGNVAVRLLRAGDFDGDGRDEVAVMGLRGRALEVRFLQGADLQPLPGEYSLDALKTANGTVADLDGDGAAELLVGPAILSLKRSPGPAAPPTKAPPAAKKAAGKGKSDASHVLPPEPRTASYDLHYRMRSLAAGDFTAPPGMEVVVLDGPDLQLCAADGTVLAAAHAPLTFTDVVTLPGSPRPSIVLGSGLAGDDNLYRVTFDPDWPKELAALAPSGERKVIQENLRGLARESAAWNGPPMVGAEGPVQVMVSHHMWAGSTSLATVGAWINEVRFFEQQFPSPRLRFSTCVWPAEQTPLMRPDGQAWSVDRRLAHTLSRDQLLAIARKFEAARCPFWIQVGHGCSPHLSAASAIAMLEAAPSMCLGFVSAEDEQAEHMTYYFEHHIRPLLEVCLTRGKHFIPRNKNVWWAHWPADPDMRRLVFNGRYRSVLLPCVEDSNTRTADTQLAARVGLWLDGQVDDWACRISADWFSFNRAWEWEAVQTGHPHLRYLTSQALLGARVFLLLAGDRERQSGQWTRVGAEGVAPFLHLIGNGALTPPRRDQLKGIAPLVVNLPHVSARFARHGANGHGFHLWDVDGTEGQAWAFDRLDCYWGMAPLPPTDASTWLWGRTRRSADQIPIPGAHGFVALLAGPPPSPGGPWNTVWTTDGDQLAKAGRTMPLSSARAAMVEDLQAASRNLPFRVEGRVFWQVVAQPENRYVVGVMDPGWVDPASRRAVVRAQIPGDWRATDRLTGKSVGRLTPDLELAIPAGGFRLLDLRTAP